MKSVCLVRRLFHLIRCLLVFSVLGFASPAWAHFCLNDPVNSIDPFGLSATVDGPQASLVQWIAPFSPSNIDPTDLYEAYQKSTGNTLSSGRAAGLNIAISQLSISANNQAPPDTLTKNKKGFYAMTSQENRGWMSMDVSICQSGSKLEDKDVNVQYDWHQGWTPFRAVAGGQPINIPIATSSGYKEAEAGSVIVTKVISGKTATITVRTRGRIGGFGQDAAAILAGIGVPYNWREITYTIDTDGKYTIKYGASYFPSANAYLNGAKVGSRSQKGLPDFMFAGAGVDAPGGDFYTQVSGKK